jgi:hypothetical protein
MVNEWLSRLEGIVADLDRVAERMEEAAHAMDEAAITHRSAGSRMGEAAGMISMAARGMSR